MKNQMTESQKLVFKWKLKSLKTTSLFLFGGQIFVILINLLLQIKVTKCFWYAQGILFFVYVIILIYFYFQRRKETIQNYL